MSTSPGRSGSWRQVPTRPCPVCGIRSIAPSPRPDRGRGGPAPIRCPCCGLVYIDPIPEAVLDPATYGADYFDPWQRPVEARRRRRLWRRRLRQVESRCPTGSLLDVGCGDGAFLLAARADGWQADGVEFSPEGARRSAARLGRPVAVGDLARDALLRGPFDVVTLWHVLEHLPDAAAMLAAVRRRLRPGGLVAVAVPNLDNLPMRLAYRLARGRPLPLYEAGTREPHLSHFDARTLRLALRRHGFEGIEVRRDACALTWPKRLIDTAAAILSRLSGRLLTDALVAFARAPR